MHQFDKPQWRAGTRPRRSPPKACLDSVRGLRERRRSSRERREREQGRPCLFPCERMAHQSVPLMVDDQNERSEQRNRLGGVWRTKFLRNLDCERPSRERGAEVVCGMIGVVVCSLQFDSIVSNKSRLQTKPAKDSVFRGTGKPAVFCRSKTLRARGNALAHPDRLSKQSMSPCCQNNRNDFYSFSSHDSSM